ncbi:uncharacterized protein LOC134539120 isoform X2 [Bacillus rossius redtenbacheri]|uniref:uncharacterized protein LOC134539120 isoform X2 n=1 Tax=Bacillus rossius redtenbacheri TaxID=93214 RepID=UPI002FDE102A
MTHAPERRRRPSEAAAAAAADYQAVPPPDGGWGWVVVFASFMIHIVTDGVTYSFGVFYEQFLVYFKESKAATAWIASILVGVTLCSGPISSSFVNRFGLRAVTVAGSVLASSCLALSVLAPNVLTLYFTVGLGTGLGFGLIYLPAIVSVTCYFEKYRSLATGIAVCGSGLGTFIFAPFIGLLVQRTQWQGAVLVVAGLVLCCAFFGALFRPLEARERPEPAATEAIEPAPVPRPLVEEEQRGDRKPQMNGSAADLTATGGGGGGGGMHRPLSLGHFATLRPVAAAPARRHGADREASRLALSQPALLGSSSSSSSANTTRQQHQQLHPAFESHSLRRKNSGIMYRKDIFYRGSLHNIPYHRSAPWLSSDHASEESQLVKPSPAEGKVGGSGACSQEDSSSDQVVVLGCVPCSPETRDTLREMLDFSLFKDPVFLLFTCSNFLTSIGFNMPYVYIKVQATEKGISENLGDYLLSVIGIANLVGRIVLGYIADKPWTNRLLIYNVCLTVCGVGRRVAGGAARRRAPVRCAGVVRLRLLPGGHVHRRQRPHAVLGALLPEEGPGWSARPLRLAPRSRGRVTASVAFVARPLSRGTVGPQSQPGRRFTRENKRL